MGREPLSESDGELCIRYLLDRTLPWNDRVAAAESLMLSVDTIILATGYRPSLEYLRELGALDEHGASIHAGGISATHLGLVYLGLEFQRYFASNTLRGVSQDALAVIAPLVAWIRDAPAAIGLTAPVPTTLQAAGRAA